MDHEVLGVLSSGRCTFAHLIKRMALQPGFSSVASSYAEAAQMANRDYLYLHMCFHLAEAVQMALRLWGTRETIKELEVWLRPIEADLLQEWRDGTWRGLHQSGWFHCIMGALGHLALLVCRVDTIAKTRPNWRSETVSSGGRARDPHDVLECYNQR